VAGWGPAPYPMRVVIRLKLLSPPSQDRKDSL
jgi:hypothetical protein